MYDSMKALGEYRAERAKKCTCPNVRLSISE